MKSLDVTWNIYKKYFFGLLILDIAELIALLLMFLKNGFIFTENSLGILIALGITLICTVFLLLLCFVSKFIVYNDRLVWVTIFKKNFEFHFSEISFRNTVFSLDAINNEGKLLFRISYLMNNAKKIINIYNQYLKENNIEELTSISKVVTANFYFKNFGIFLSIFGLIIVIFSLTGVVYIGLVGIVIILMFLGFTQLLLGICLILYYLKFSIILDSKSIFIGKRSIDLSNLYLSTTMNTISIYENQKRVIRININFYQNCDLLLKTIKPKIEYNE